MAVRSLTRGGGKAFKPQVQGLKELDRKLKALKPDNPALTKEIFEVVGHASDDVRDQMRSEARMAGWSSEKIRTPKSGTITGDDAIASIFSSSKPRGGDSRKRISALAGVGKRRTMVEWRAGRFPKSPRAKVAPGKMVAESFAMMLEIGTSNRKARPAIRMAIVKAKQGVIDSVAEGFRNLIAKYSK